MRNVQGEDKDRDTPGIHIYVCPVPCRRGQVKLVSSIGALGAMTHETSQTKLDGEYLRRYVGPQRDCEGDWEHFLHKTRKQDLKQTQRVE